MTEPKVSEMTFSIDDRVKIKGGRFKGLVGDVVAVKTAFLSVRMEGMPQLGKVAKKNWKPPRKSNSLR